MVTFSFAHCCYSISKRKSWHSFKAASKEILLTFLIPCWYQFVGEPREGHQSKMEPAQICICFFWWWRNISKTTIRAESQFSAFNWNEARQIQFVKWTAAFAYTQISGSPPTRQITAKCIYTSIVQENTQFQPTRTIFSWNLHRIRILIQE